MFGKKMTSAKTGSGTTIKMTRARSAPSAVTVEINGRRFESGRKRKPLIDRILDPLELKLRRFAIKRLMLYLTVISAAVFIFDIVIAAAVTPGTGLFYYLNFNRELILHGQIWRLITFVFVPPYGDYFSTALELYFGYFIGSALERTWGSFRFDVFYLTGVICCIAAGFVCGRSSVMYLNLSLFLAYALFFPEKKVLLFFILPIKVKILALIEAAVLILRFAFGSFSEKILIAFPLLPLILFFGSDMLLLAGQALRKKRRRR